MVVCEEVARVNAYSFGLTLGLQDDLVLHYLLDLTNEEQKKRWLPGFAAGELIGALAMTEPGTGSDLQGIRTTARRDGDHWILNGQKTFISSGIMADLVVVAARTDPDRRLGGFSLLVVERDTARVRAGPQARQDRPARPRTPPSCSSTTRGCRPTTCSARRAAACST